ncbi:uncharacterized protein LOC102615671 isoform X7 [Citrus sinensis]|uniref:uncharacterized protein LOC102615671 isoform X7 n=1 Tax=Citrus sinensis TaxID=2711 RepID=UPI000D626C71|nr:uncharacterized protein LOC102615671 isoform X7 [Citrus sinensis]
MLGRSLTAMTKYHLKQDIKLGSKLGICKRWISSTLQRRFAALWGNGDYGRLGLGSLESRWRPVVCSAFEKHSLKALACGGAHTLFLTDCGLWPVFRLGLTNHSSPLTVQKLAAFMLLVLMILDSSAYQKILVTLCGWGALHVGKELKWTAWPWKNEYTPRLIKELEGVKVKIAAAGFLHSACIDENGRVYIFGDRAVDKMLFQEGNHARRPSLISKLPYSEEVVCGGYHTCVLTSGGELYTWGSNENGCLGIGSIDVLHSPERVQGPFSESPVDQICTSIVLVCSTMMLTSLHESYTITLLNFTIQVSCGWKHTAAISEGKILTWGWGGSHGTFSEDGHSSGGQLGHGNDVDYIHPTIVNFGENVKALQVSCGFNHTALAVTECAATLFALELNISECYLVLMM